ncbi:MAG TPA: hypothetical protein VIO64_03605 [Pseudobacteroides sp.]|uniref:hypothetical protein n=1 Tax=Pseudobacteroides sp. TaxID=1968840 RepID=UPI002F91E330
MNDFFCDSNNKSSKIIQVNNIYSEQGQDFESVLKNAIKNILIGGKIPGKVLELNKQIVIANRAKEEEF